MSLNHAQAEAVACNTGPCMVLAGPGSGKTLTIAKRIEYLIQTYKVRPEEILVITFTKYAALEMRERFRRIAGQAGNGVTFGTFHGVYYGILRWAYGDRGFRLVTDEEKLELIRLAASEMDWEDQGDIESERERLQELAIEIGKVKNQGISIENYRPSRGSAEKFARVYKEYECMKQKAGRIDFEDMLLMCRKLFKERPDILKKWQERFRYILVDEFQDINQVQYDVIRMLAAPEDNLFVVGDDDQSIYGFRGARPGIMMRFCKDYPFAKRILLDQNYRSTANIVKSALRVIDHNQERYQKKISSVFGAGETVHVQEVKDPLEESQYVADEIRKQTGEGKAFRDIAVLYRTNLDARILSETLTEYQIPFLMKEQIHNIYDHFIGLDISSYFHLAMGDTDRKYFLQVANRPKRYLAREAMKGKKISYESIRNFYCDKDWMMDRIDQWEWDMKMMRDKTPFAAIQYIRKSIGYDEFLKEYAAYKKIALDELLSVLEEIQQSSKRFATMEEWFRHVEEYGEALKKQKKKEKDQDQVMLMTMHGAKGLEFDTVFIIHGNEGCIPYKKAKTEEEIEEERRLFYVAMTRAKKKLTISYVKEQNGKDQDPSRFVEELFLV
nr:ATP-dependent helicase [uncultured Merdimonas sp.]